LYLTFLFELCLLGLVKFPFEIRFFGHFFGDVIPKGGNLGPKQASVS
jgi:hypothetical protein